MPAKKESAARKEKRPLRALPSVDETLRDPAVKKLVGPFPRGVVVDAVREAIAAARARLAGGEPKDGGGDALARDVASRVRAFWRPSLRRAVNATGVILHTGLGRAPLAREAIEAVSREASGYCLLEIDAERGERGARDTHVAEALRRLSGAEDATVVNNNAGATLLILNTLAAGGEVLLSRGQMVEIGGSYRIPDVMEKSGATLVSVGTTNRTRLADYERAIGPRTRAILRVHPSNYRIVGFAEETPLAELVALGAKAGVPVIDDLGSGALVDLSRYGLAREPLVSESVAAGADVLCFSGDKLLGGPQAGIVAGKKAVVSRIRSNALARALRVDKMTLAALEATLRLFAGGEAELARSHPVVRMIAAPIEEIRARAEALRVRVLERRPAVDAAVVPESSSVGGGSLPAETLPTACLALRAGAMTADALARALRAAPVPVFSRVKDERVLLDLRTIGPGPDEDAVVEAIERAAPARA